jgi:serine protease Do
MRHIIVASILTTATLFGTSIDFKEAPENVKRVMPQTQGEILSYHDAIGQSTSAIVNIATTQQVDQARIPQQVHPFFEQFFGPGFRFQQPERKRSSLGSGVIISPDGYIITNNHVIDKADSIVVTLPEANKEYTAEVIGTDPGTDIAVIKIDAEDLPSIAMGRSDKLQVGDVVFAIGNPYGIGQTVTQGIISAQHKSGIGINRYENYIQTDASINPGNSGGALVDSRGALIGINTAIITRSGGNHGVGFAIEVDMVKEVATKLIEDGSIKRGYLGVGIEDLSKSMKKLYKHDYGAVVTDVMEGTAAASAGLKRGDLILKVDDRKIGDRNDLQNAIGFHTPGKKVTITFEREEKVRTVTAKLGDQEQIAAAGSSGKIIEGLELSDLSDALRYRNGIPANVQGVLVTGVTPASEADEQNIKPGDIIIQVEQQVINDTGDLVTVMSEPPKGYKRIYLNRGGRVFVAVLK